MLTMVECTHTVCYAPVDGLTLGMVFQLK